MTTGDLFAAAITQQARRDQTSRAIPPAFLQLSPPWPGAP